MIYYNQQHHILSIPSPQEVIALIIIYQEKSNNGFNNCLSQILSNWNIITMLSTRLAHSFCTKQKQSNLNILYEMSKQAKTPFFTLQSHHIEIIDDPLQFYLALHRQAKKAVYRIGLSSLYLGTGSLERFLFNTIVKRIKNVPSLHATMVFDYNRSLRPEKGQSSVQMMSGYLDEEVSKRLKISLNKQAHSKYKILGEISGVHHQKIALFDDTVIIGGANLSHNYFLNRRDRYMKIKQCSELADYLHDYLKVLQENGFQVQNNVPIQNKASNLTNHYRLWKFSYTPEQYKPTLHDQEKDLDRLKQQKQKQSLRTIHLAKPKVPKDKNVIISEALGSDIKPFEPVPEWQKKQRIDTARQRLFSVGDENDVGNFIMDVQDIEEEKEMAEVGEKVYIFPFIQYPNLKETMEPKVFSSILQNSIENKLPIKISSGYMNFTNDTINLLSKSTIPTQVLCSAPQANSFFRGGTLKKFIPYFYRNFEGMILSKWGQKFKIKQYFDGKWSFHAKGVWIKQYENSYLTILGSSNYNRRSQVRDTQLQLYMHSTCEKFNGRLEKQWKNIEKDCKQVTLDTIKQDKEIKFNTVFNWLSKLFARFL